MQGRTFSVESRSGSVRVVDGDGRVWAGMDGLAVHPFDEGVRLLDIVHTAYAQGMRDAVLAAPRTFSIEKGTAPDGRSPVWAVQDVSGTVFAAVGRSRLFTNPSTASRKLLETVETLYAVGREDTIARRLDTDPETPSAMASATGR